MSFKQNDAVQITYNTIINEVGRDYLKVRDVEKNLEFYIRGESLLETVLSADFFSSKEKLTKTEIAEKLLGSHGKIFKVEFEKQDGTKRTLRGYLAKTEPILGRSYCVDLDVTDKNKLRLVDHRTIHSLIIEGTFYYV